MTAADGAAEPLAQIEGVAIHVNGQMVAWFADPHEGREWASATYFGNWFMHPFAIPIVPHFSSEQIAEASRSSEVLFSKLSEGSPEDC